MAAVPHHHVIDEDDDDFDWDEAVRAIDVACQGTNSSATSGAPQSTGSFAFENKRSSTVIQSTIDQFIGNTVPRQAPAPEKWKCIDEDAARTWIYPVNVPLRDYQLSIAKKALFTNTLVVLPTGLGKTLIAAVVMYNYFRWFPKGKIVFAAPSRPLVMQQIEACHNIAGIPQEWAIDMTGQTSPAKRASLWKSKRVFFLTPQVLEKDIQSGTCLTKRIVCLVIDEAHRAVGNYSYCVVVRELMAIHVDLRIVALTATPGSNKETIQQIIHSLQISILEYRSESDPDVSPYMHDKKIELIQIPVGEDVAGVSNILLDVIRPFVTRLSASGLLPKRDLQTLSPCDVLDSRDKFRQTSLEELPGIRVGDVEGYFAALITLYYIRKLLSAHGIRPAYEMLDEKLKHGSFLKLVGKNEAFWNAKSLMEKSIGDKVPSPKLSKLIEVLSDHFERNNPQDSRVIIFSNYRGSVREIMKALATMGESVKAAEFIGQSSGKKRVKGLTQKVQQAVLDKFRAGGYNIIVATSIGEEGLDIIEVGMVICFDANISSLRMIQRMGRTGRNSDGRVVVLACEGAELKGYSRKQMHGKYIEKQMRNGGVDSFNFHHSPRMIPHVFKPEVEFVRASIQKYVRRGKKVKDDKHHPVNTSDYSGKTKDGESELLSRLLRGDGCEGWRPSLIAFPKSQALPSHVRDVMHSVRTGMFVAAMKVLHGVPETHSFDSEVEESPQRFSESGLFDNEDDELSSGGDASAQSGGLLGALEPVAIPPPILSGEGILLVYSEEVEAAECRTDPEVADYEDIAIVSTPLRCSTPDRQIPKSTSSCSERVGIPVLSEEEREEEEEEGLHNRVSKVGEAPASRISECRSAFNDPEFSPRLTNFIESGVVPESPIHGAYTEPRDGSPLLDIVVPATPPDNNNVAGAENTHQGSSVPFPDAEAHPPYLNTTECSCSTDWKMSSGEKSQNAGQAQKFKRLRKYGVNCKRNPSQVPEELLDIKQNLEKSFSRCFRSPKQEYKGTTHIKNVRTFVEEEAEVSSNAQVSDDEGNSEDGSSYEGSFIDDAVNTTLSGSQGGRGSVDMMAIYRRSLLSQSPIQYRPHFSVGHSASPNPSPVKDLKTGHPFTAAGSAEMHLDEGGGGDDYDRFYDGIDLDEVEAQATMILRSRSEIRGSQIIPGLEGEGSDAMESPSFDLGV